MSPAARRHVIAMSGASDERGAIGHTRTSRSALSFGAGSGITRNVELLFWSDDFGGGFDNASVESSVAGVRARCCCRSWLAAGVIPTVVAGFVETKVVAAGLFVAELFAEEWIATGFRVPDCFDEE